MHRSVAVGFVVIALVMAGMAGGAVLTDGGPDGTQASEAMTVSDQSAMMADSQSATTVDGQSATTVDGQSATVDTVPARIDGGAQDFDRTTFEVEVHEDGSAEWTFKHERVLSSDEEIEQFEAYAERFEAEETDQYERFVDSAMALTSSGQNFTEREMEATDFDRSARFEQRFNAQGVVEMSFTWTNFAVVQDDGRVVVSDVFEGGIPLVSDQRLSIASGENLVFEHVQPESDAEYTGTLRNTNSIWWDGPYEFGDGQPHVVMAPAGGAASADDSGWSVFGYRLPVLAGAILVAVIGLVAFAWYRFGERSPDIDVLGGQSSPAAPSTESDDEHREDTMITSEELMTDEDRVVALIRRNGGRMKQVNIVEETGWSKSKVSMLLSEMADDGTISKLRVGRENIISLEGFEPEATKSPFDE